MLEESDLVADTLTNAEVVMMAYARKGRNRSQQGYRR